MNDYVIILIVFVALILGGFVGQWVAKLKFQSQQATLLATHESLNKKLAEINQEKNILQENIESYRAEKETLNISLTKSEAALTNLRKLYEEEDRLQERFKNLASELLEEKSTKFTKLNSENLKQILTPLGEKILAFEKKVESTNKESIERHGALKEQLVHLKGISEQMSQETLNLTKALKGDSKIQGNWGELILERVLEKSGLEKGREFTIQESFTREDGSRVQPDVIIHLPDNKKMVVDAKVSLTAYERYANAENETDKAQALKQHLLSFNAHIDTLASKNYEDLYEIESPDFVLLFVPIETAFALALSQQDNLYNKAFEKNIVIVTPSTLLATLGVIESMWKNEKQQRNALEIARQAGALYDKFHGLATDLLKVGKRMDEAKGEYESAMNKLVSGKGNLVRSAEKLRKMGAKSKKELPQTLIERASENDEDLLA